MMRKRTFFINVLLFGIVTVFFFMGSVIIHILTGNVQVAIIYLFSIDITFYIGYYLAKTDIKDEPDA